MDFRLVPLAMKAYVATQNGAPKYVNHFEVSAANGETLTLEPGGAGSTLVTNARGDILAEHATDTQALLSIARGLTTQTADIENTTPISAREVTFRAALENFIRAGETLCEVWGQVNADGAPGTPALVTWYPKYLPSFDEFLSRFASIMDEPDPDVSDFAHITGPSL